MKKLLVLSMAALFAAGVSYGAQPKGAGAAAVEVTVPAVGTFDALMKAVAGEADRIMKEADSLVVSADELVKNSNKSSYGHEYLSISPLYTAASRLYSIIASQLPSDSQRKADFDEKATEALVRSLDMLSKK